MLDPSLLRSESDAVVEELASRGSKPDVDKLRALEGRRRAPQIRTENLQAKRNSRSKSIGQVKARGEDIESLRLEVNELGEELDVVKVELDTLQAEIRDITLTIPNLPADDVSMGGDENDNVEVSHWGTPREFDFEVCDRVTLGEVHAGLGFAAAVKLTGSRFVVMKGQIAHMHRALSQFMLDLCTEQHGYSENYAPYLVNHDTLYGTGQLPRFAGDLFRVRPLDEEADSSSYALAPTAEVSLTNLVRDETIDENALPIKMTAHTPCFRSEADSYGRDARGLIRMHQSDKAKMVQIVRPENSMNALEEVADHTGEVLQLLGLSYRKIVLCTGDTGFNVRKTYDLEVWIPAQNAYREISSCSDMWDLQARRIQVRCCSKSGKKTRLVYTSNDSGLVVGRTLATVMENYQQVDGRIQVPEVLRSYMNGLESIG